MKSTFVFRALGFGMIWFANLSRLGAQTAAPERSPVAPENDKIIHISVLVPVSANEAFRYFSENALLESWLTATAEVQPQVEGKYELFWLPDDRENNSTIGCRVTAVAEGQLLSFQWRSPKQFKAFANLADPLTHVVVTFVPEGSGTRVHLIHSGWRSSPEWEEARLWQENAWRGAFQELGRVSQASHGQAQP